MYVVKNALRNISRSKGRNSLIAVIVLVISVSACIALSIRAASERAAEEAAEDLEITAQISVDRQAMMQGREDRDGRKEALQGMDTLELDELEVYAGAKSVSGFYYTKSVSVDGASLEAVDLTGNTEETENTEMVPRQEQMPGAAEGQEAEGGKMQNQGAFILTGYSSDEALEDFIDGNSAIKEGEMFTEGTADFTCVIHEDLASYNDIETGDQIVLVNPDQEEDTYTLTVSGIYEKEGENDSASAMMGGFMPGADAANQIYISYPTLEEILEQSESFNTETALKGMLNATYTFDSEKAYEEFQEEARELGLSDSYTITSPDLTAYQESLKPLQNLSSYAGYFLILILAVGGIILIVLQIFVIRERKYEIGVLAAIGMKKIKIAQQFLMESFCVTFCALLLGVAAGAVSSVPIANALLQNQIESSADQQITQRFGRETGQESQSAPELPGGRNEGQEPTGETPQKMTGNYIERVTSATDMQVVVEMLGLGILLTLFSGGTALVSVMRYDPLKILSSRE